MFALRLLDFRLLGVLLLSNFIPVIYSTVRVYFLGTVPETWAFSIASQVAWLNLMYEVISEGLLLPLYFILGQVINNSKKLSERISTALVYTVMTYALLSVIVLLFAETMVYSMGQSEALLEKTVSYIKLESFALLLSSVYAVITIVLVIQKREPLLYLLLVIKTALIVFLDSLFVSHLPFSLQLGVNGVAWTNIVMNALLAMFSIAWLIRSGVSLRFTWKAMRLAWIRCWMQISIKSGLESLVRNLAFMIMILKMINEVQQSGVYWITNQFIWGWLLLPILTLGNLIKQDAACNEGDLGARFIGYLQFTALVSLGWILTMPSWEWFVGNMMGVTQARQVAELAQLLIGFYIVFAFNNILDSYFYGIGRTDLMLYQSILVSGLFYGSAYALYKTGYFVPTLESIAIMFGLGITADALVTAALYAGHRKQIHQRKPFPEDINASKHINPHSPTPSM